MLELFPSVCEKTICYDNEIQNLIGVFSMICLLWAVIKVLKHIFIWINSEILLSKVYFNEKEIERNLNFPTVSGLSVSKLFEILILLFQKTDLMIRTSCSTRVWYAGGVSKGKGFSKILKCRK